ncbi:hypothetical protein QWY31_10095 [Cytophagales bacterium LB-30]|uniref:Carboxypeptidase-like regulatory domain-containing protein n=1 Tax=Shiella aurantiaca TaxID=3058365 RepID=A0ABT8F5W9_9BACT|nr:hypothetical protein [Shiella aurantiaca]MDN4165856.1 hypothetical protein [Shiella aurantiaca]
MKRYLIIPALVIRCFLNALAQKKVIVADAVNRKALAFAEVQFATSGFYTTKEGVAILYDTALYYTISYLGFETLEVNPKMLSKDTLYLNPKPLVLEEFIFQAYPHTRKVDFLTIPKKNYSGWPLQGSREVVTRIYPENEIVGVLKNVAFSFEKDIFKKPDKGSDEMALVRFNVYSNDSILTHLYSSKAIEIQANASEKVFLDLREDKLLMSEDGLAIGVEYLGQINSEGTILTNEHVVYLSLSAERSPLYKQNTLVRSVFDNKAIIIPSLEKHFHAENLPHYKGDTRNLAIAFEVFTKE